MKMHMRKPIKGKHYICANLPFNSKTTCLSFLEHRNLYARFLMIFMHMVFYKILLLPSAHLRLYSISNGCCFYNSLSPACLETCMVHDVNNISATVWLLVWNKNLNSLKPSSGEFKPVLRGVEWFMTPLVVR